MVEVSCLCHHFLQRKLSNKRGPPVLPNRLQKKGNASDTMIEDKAADSKKEGKEEGVIRWDLITTYVSFVYIYICIIYILIPRRLSAGVGRWSTLTKPQKAPRMRKRTRIHLPTKRPNHQKSQVSTVLFSAFRVDYELVVFVEHLLQNKNKCITVLVLTVFGCDHEM